MKRMYRHSDGGGPAGRKKPEDAPQSVTAPDASLIFDNHALSHTKSKDIVFPQLTPFVDALAELLAQQLVRELTTRRTLETRPFSPEVGVDPAGSSRAEC